MASHWITKINNIRKSLDNGVTEKSMSDELFVFDILKALCEDDVDTNTKLHLLGFLEEFAHLVNNLQSIDDVVISILDIFHETAKDRVADKKLICQMLATMTTLLIIHNSCISPDTESRLIGIQLEIISSSNDTFWLLVRSKAIDCLQEIELMKPGILASKLGSIYQVTLAENSYLCSKYTCMLSCVLRNFIMHCSSLEKLSDKYIKDSLLNTQDYLKNFSVDDIEQHKDIQGTYIEPMVNAISPDAEMTTLTSVVSHIVDNYTYMTPAQVACSLEYLIDIFRVVSNLSVSMFKPHIRQLMSSLDIVSFHTLLKLQLTFNNLVGEEDGVDLVKHLVILGNNPLFTSGQRLLYLHWLLCLNDIYSDTKKVLCREDSWQIAFLSPTIFDGLDTQAIKLRATTLWYTPSSVPDEDSSKLMLSLKLLYTLSAKADNRKAAILLFKCLYHMYNHHHYTCLPDLIKQYMIDITSANPFMAPHALDFLEKISSDSTDRSNIRDVLHSLHNNVLRYRCTLPTMVSFIHILNILLKSSLDPSINPKSTIDLLGEICSHLKDDQWICGHYVLSVVKNILITHDITYIYQDLSTLLFNMANDFPNIDVRDRARYYYLLLIKMSHHQIISVLSKSLSSDYKSLENMVGEANKLVKKAVITVEKPVLHLARKYVVCRWIPEIDMADSGPCNTVADYVNEISHYKISVEILCDLTVVTESQQDIVYAILIQARSEQNALSSDVSVPYIHHNEVKEITLKFSPTNSHPLHILLSTMFCNKSQQLFTHPLCDIDVALYEQFLPVPSHLIPEESESWFLTLWNHLEQRTKEKIANNHSIQSVQTFPLSLAHVMQFLSSHYSKFLTTSDSSFDSSSKPQCMAVILPPNQHLLITFKQEDDITVATCTMDHWVALKNLDEIFGAIF